MSDPELTSGLESSRATLFAVLHDLAEEQFRFIPPAESWSIAVHLAHLLRIERLFTERARRALAEEEPSVLSTGVTNEDEPALAQRLAVPQMIHGLQAVRRDLVALLDGCDGAALDRAIRHERFGRMTVRQIAEKMIGHEREHAAAIDALATQARAATRVTIPLTPRS